MGGDELTSGMKSGSRSRVGTPDLQKLFKSSFSENVFKVRGHGNQQSPNSEEHSGERYITKATGMGMTNSGLPPSSSDWGLASNDIIVVSEEGVKVKLVEPKLPAQFLSATPGDEAQVITSECRVRSHLCHLTCPSHKPLEAPLRLCEQQTLPGEGSYVYRVVLAGETEARDIWCRNPGKRRTLHHPRPLGHKEDSELQACKLREVRSKVQRAYQKLSSSGRLCAHPDKLKRTLR
ncbi:hypothetical protein U0070_003576 [Myodes glareolus]|uniref:Uncharacterized protein n=1 Tax=Myodes glareolus TaxID=447135 RepID=A0AAW0J0K2_MYOGA